MSEDIERLNRIFDDLKQQYHDKSSPLMILSDVEPEDLEFLRNNIRLVCRAYLNNSSCGKTLLTYIIIDHVYENYAENDEEGINLWPLVKDFL